jgi:hypothetical protein
VFLLLPADPGEHGAEVFVGPPVRFDRREDRIGHGRPGERDRAEVDGGASGERCGGCTSANQRAPVYVWCSS